VCAACHGSMQMASYIEKLAGKFDQIQCNFNTNPYLKLPSKFTSCDCLTIAGNLLSTGLYTGEILGTTGTGAMIGAGVTVG